MTKETLRMQMLSGVITESEYKAKLEELNSTESKDSLNEGMIGGIVGIGAINQIPPRAKTDYENAFEHFLGSKYELNEEVDEVEVEDDEALEDVSLDEAEDAFNAPSDTNPVVQGYLEQLTNILNTQTDDMFDLKNLKYAVDKFSNMVNNEIAKFEVEEGKEVEEPSLYEGEEEYNQIVDNLIDNFDDPREASAGIDKLKKMGMWDEFLKSDKGATFQKLRKSLR